jgi:hypothetical protein
VIFLNAIEAKKPCADLLTIIDLIFLNVEMPVISDFIDGLKVKPQVIFILL